MINKNDPREKNIEKKCHICRLTILVNHLGHGDCHHCGWFQSKNNGEHPDKVLHPNLVSYNRAKELVSLGQALKPRLKDFIEGLMWYSEMEFFHKSKRYGVVKPKSVYFYEWDVVESEQEFSSAEEFYNKAHINGVLLKDLWHEVEEPNYM